MKEIIDFKRKGNQVRFYLGKNGTQWGNYWDQIPYEHMAERVNSNFIEGSIIKTFNFDDLVAEPSFGTIESMYSKQDMVNRAIPCLAVIPAENKNPDGYDIFDDVLKDPNCKKIFFGDLIEEENK